jgi:hypothetical protein
LKKKMQENLLQVEVDLLMRTQGVDEEEDALPLPRERGR